MEAVFDSIAYGKTDATLEEVIEASKIAKAYEFIVKLPIKMRNSNRRKRSKLSGGFNDNELSCSRALIRKPKILIFDEATSSLDSNPKKQYRKLFQKIIIINRPS
jgi:ABC-type multidrug transport system fused ATPase/permease subunit